VEEALFLMDQAEEVSDLLDSVGRRAVGYSPTANTAPEQGSLPCFPEAEVVECREQAETPDSPEAVALLSEED
jgi:hypothetical protein